MSERAIVTGASSGIGRAFATQLAERGYAVTGVARREDELRALVDELGDGDHTYLVADLGSAQGIASVTEVMEAEHVDLLVNNAGYGILEPFYESKLEKQRNMLELNCGALMDLSHAFLRQSRAGDALINVSSIVSFLPMPSQPVYSASKAFVTSLSECLWDEHRSRGVYVMALCPGITSTEFIRTATGGESDGDKLPSVAVQSAEEVVREGLAALKKRDKAVVVTGRMNRMMTQMPRFMTRQSLLKALAKFGDPEKVL